MKQIKINNYNLEIDNSETLLKVKASDAFGILSVFYIEKEALDEKIEQWQDMGDYKMRCELYSYDDDKIFMKDITNEDVINKYKNPIKTTINDNEVVLINEEFKSISKELNLINSQILSNTKRISTIEIIYFSMLIMYYSILISGIIMLLSIILNYNLYA